MAGRWFWVTLPLVRNKRGTFRSRLCGHCSCTGSKLSRMNSRPLVFHSAGVLAWRNPPAQRSPVILLQMLSCSRAKSRTSSVACAQLVASVGNCFKNFSISRLIFCLLNRLLSVLYYESKITSRFGTRKLFGNLIQRISTSYIDIKAHCKSFSTLRVPSHRASRRSRRCYSSCRPRPARRSSGRRRYAECIRWCGSLFS